MYNSIKVKKKDIYIYIYIYILKCLFLITLYFIWLRFSGQNSLDYYTSCQELLYLHVD